MHVNTPLLDQQVGHQQVALKLECDQPTGSFKIRGMGHLCRIAKAQGARAMVSSSGGNAGLAVAYGAHQLGLDCHVVVPHTTPQLTVERLQALGARVHQQGEDWNAADAVAQQLCRELNGFYAHPFDHPDIWAGHASIVHECAETGLEPDCVVLAVGGGGLLCGVLRGMAEVGWENVPLVAVETRGAASLQASMAAGRLVALDGINTIALTLGARQVASQAFELSQQRRIESRVVTDQQALAGCYRLADDHRRLVEPACGAALSVVYEGELEARRPLVIVCGGAGVNLSMLQAWSEQLATQAAG